MWDYQDDSDDDEERVVGITCIKMLPNNREAVVYGDGEGNLTIYDSRTKSGSSLGLYSRGGGGNFIDLCHGLAHKGGISALEVVNDGVHVVSGGRDGTLSVWFDSYSTLTNQRRNKNWKQYENEVTREIDSAGFESSILYI